MSSFEIEDVVSSIRRLVTKDLRQKPPAAKEKLLLTPALRVVPKVEATPEIALEDAAYTEDATVEIPVFIHTERASSDLSEAVTSIGAAMPDEGYESETGEIGPADAVPVPDWPGSSWVAPDVISEIDEAEVVVVSDDDTPGWAQAASLDMLGGDTTDDAVEAPYTHAADDDAPVDPHGDVAEAAALAALAEQDDVDEAPEMTELDEEMLREIVRDIIREELQGSLGERITRNVRKLVRAEINRAMATRDLE
jgi:hypothetical protein